ncbi:hypothetical protein [Micromonospora sp. LOL_015]|uniref:hypothetical protein n=1 Tax=Micromonospora sp. LOL_015 TaxID=3345416 RepID=UPI003A89B2DF
MGLDQEQSQVVGLIGTVVAGGRDGRMVAIAVYKSALTRPGVVERPRPVNGETYDNQPHEH